MIRGVRLQREAKDLQAVADLETSGGRDVPQPRKRRSASKNREGEFHSLRKYRSLGFRAYNNLNLTTESAAPVRHSHAAFLQWLTIVHGFAEGGASLLASGLAGSVALLSFGLDSMIEVLSAAIVLWRIISLSRRHRWGISERTGLRMVGVCFMLLAITVGADAIKALVQLEQPKESLLGIIVAAISVISMPFLAAAKRRISGDIESHAMRADARQTDFCAYLAAILLLGLLAYKLFGWWWADPVAAIAMTPIMLWEGIQAIRGHACGCVSC